MCRANNIAAADSPNGLFYSAVAGALQVIAKELWLVTAWQEPPDDAPQPASDP